MWRGDCLCIIDFGLAVKFHKGDASRDYENFITVYKDNIGINKRSLHLTLSNMGYRGLSNRGLWRLLNKYDEVQYILENVVDLETIDHFRFSDSIVDLVNEFPDRLFGQPCAKFLEVFYSS
jgi:hypothetical protein